MVMMIVATASWHILHTYRDRVSLLRVAFVFVFRLHTHHASENGTDHLRNATCFIMDSAHKAFAELACLIKSVLRLRLGILIDSFDLVAKVMDLVTQIMAEVCHLVAQVRDFDPQPGHHIVHVAQGGQGEVVRFMGLTAAVDSVVVCLRLSLLGMLRPVRISLPRVERPKEVLIQIVIFIIFQLVCLVIETKDLRDGVSVVAEVVLRMVIVVVEAILSEGVDLEGLVLPSRIVVFDHASWEQLLDVIIVEAVKVCLVEVRREVLVGLEADVWVIDRLCLDRVEGVGRVERDV